MIELGNYAEDAVIDFDWATNGADGASITRATNGTVAVYKGNSTTEITAGVTDTEDHDGDTGVHHCRIDTSADAAYSTGEDYTVRLKGGVIDGQTVNAPIARFSIEHRYNEVVDYDPPTNAEFEARTVPAANYVETTDLPSNFGGMEIAADGSVLAGDGSEAYTSINPILSQLQTRTVAGDSSVVAAAGADGDTLKSLSDQLDTVGGYLDTEVAAILASVDTEVAAILADTNEIQIDWADGGRLDAILDARASQSSVNTIDGIVDDILLDTAEIGTAGAGLTEAGGTGDHLTALASQSSVNTLAGYVDTEVAAILAAVDTEIAAILADTGELQTDWADGGRLDLLLDAVKAVTDALGSTAAGRLKLSAETMVPGTVDNTGFSPTTTEFEADDITEATADHFNGRIVIFTSGALQYQATDITEYALASGRGHFTVTALTEAPGNDVTFIIV